MTSIGGAGAAAFILSLTRLSSRPHRLRTRRGSERYDVERRSGDETDAKLSVRSANAKEATIFSQAASANRRTDDMVLAYLVELDN
jgi:hypothetical protein